MGTEGLVAIAAVSAPGDVPAGDLRERNVRAWLLRLSKMFSVRLKGLPPGTNDVALQWYYGADGTFGAVCYAGMDHDGCGDPSPYYFGFTGEGDRVLAVTVQQDGIWLGVSVGMLDHHMQTGLRGQKYNFRYVARYFDEIQRRRLLAA